MRPQIVGAAAGLAVVLLAGCDLGPSVTAVPPPAEVVTSSSASPSTPGSGSTGPAPAQSTARPVQSTPPPTVPAQNPTADAPTDAPMAPTCGAPPNTDGLNFCHRGHLVTRPPADVCTVFSCIKNFRNGKGYLEQCNDGMVSMSGGRPGACSYHGGEKQPIYQG